MNAESLDKDPSILISWLESLNLVSRNTYEAKSYQDRPSVFMFPRINHLEMKSDGTKQQMANSGALLDELKLMGGELFQFKY